MATVDFVTLAEAKAQLETSASANDALISALITSASRALNNRYQREVTPTSTASRRFPVKGTLVDLAPFDLRSVTSVTLHPEATSPVVLTANDYALLPVALGNTYLTIQLSGFLTLWSAFSQRFGYAQLDIAGGWGAFDTSSVPEDLKRACILTVGAWIDRAVAEYAAEFGPGASLERGLRPPSPGSWAIPSAAHRLMAPWERMTY